MSALRSVALAALLGLASCDGQRGAPERPDASVEPAPVGAAVGAAGTDATGLPLARDSVAATGSHP